MITINEALQAATELRPGDEPAGVMTNGRDFVVGFASREGEFNNLTVLVDGETGEAHAQSVQEYTAMMPELREVA